MRGHCEIRLHNKETHTYKKIDADNLVTNAYKYRLSYQTVTGLTSAANTFPIAETILGGLMLFDGPLTENAENICFPSEAHLVGYGDRSADAADPMRGTYNLLESGQSDRGYTHVWDFSTAQCNKTIGAVSLTGVSAVNDRLKNGGYVLSGISDFDHWVGSRYHDGEYAYTIQSEDQKQNLYRWPVPCGAVKVSTRYYYGNGDRTLQEYVKTIHDFSGESEPSGGFVYSDGGYFVRAFLGSYSSSGGYENTLTYDKIQISDWSYIPAVTARIDGITSHQLTGWGWAGSYYYAYYAADKTIYKINPANIADIRTFTFDQKYTNVLWMGCHSNGIVSVRLYDSEHSGSNKYVPIMIYPDGEVVTFGSYFGSISYGIYSQEGHSEVLYPQRNNQMDTNCYLGTICNLSSPVTKTAATTMKVIYTLTDV